MYADTLQEDGFSRTRPQLTAWVLGAAGWSLLLLGFLTPWIKPQTRQFYVENETWLVAQLLDLSEVEQMRPLFEGLSCTPPCDLPAKIAASPWAAFAETFAAGRGLNGWELLFGPFAPSAGIRILAGSYLLNLLLPLVCAVRHTEIGRGAAFLIGTGAGLSLLLSVFYLPVVDTLGYQDQFLLSLIATMGGSHQGWGLWMGLAGLFLLQIFSVTLWFTALYTASHTHSYHEGDTW